MLGGGRVGGFCRGVGALALRPEGDRTTVTCFGFSMRPTMDDLVLRVGREGWLWRRREGSRGGLEEPEALLGLLF